MEMSFGDRVNHALAAIGKDRYYLAAKLGLHERTVKRWIYEGKVPKSPKIPLIASALGVTVNWLETGEGEQVRAVVSTDPSYTLAAQALVNAMPWPCAITDKDLRYVAVNDVYVDVFAHEDVMPLVGKSVYDITPPEYMPVARARYSAALAGEPVYLPEGETYTYTNSRGDDVVFVFEMHPWRDHTGEVSGVLFIACQSIGVGGGTTGILFSGENHLQGYAPVNNDLTSLVHNRRDEDNRLLAFVNALLPLVKAQLMHMPAIKVGEAIQRVLSMTLPFVVNNVRYDASVVVNVSRPLEDLDKPSPTKKEPPPGKAE